MRIFIIALLAAISYAQTEFHWITEAVGTCMQIRFSKDCPAFNIGDVNNSTEINLVQDACDIGTYGYICVANQQESLYSACGNYVMQQYVESCSACGVMGCIQANVPPSRSPTPGPTVTAFVLQTGSKDEGVDPTWVIAALLIVLFVCQMIFFAWCCYQNAQETRGAKRDVYSVELPNAPQSSAPKLAPTAPETIMITGPDGEEAPEHDLTLEKTDSRGGDSISFKKSGSPSASTYQVEDGSLPKSFYKFAEEEKKRDPSFNSANSLAV